MNVGSVGKPKDGDRRACYGILDTGAPIAAEFVRIEYQISPESQPRFVRASFPREFASDLETAGAAPAKE